MTFPANTKARVKDVKAAGVNTVRDFEKFLRDAGFSIAQAKSIASHGFKADDLRDEDEAALLVAAIERNIKTLSQ